MSMVLTKPKATKKKSWDSNNSNTEKEEKGHYISVRFPPFFILQEVIMNIKDCIDLVDNEKPNQYTIKEKVMWLSFIEAIIINEVLKTHEGYDGRYDMFEGYSEDKLTVKLIVPAPYDRLYTQYLKMKIDEANGEITRYNNSAALYNAYMSEYRKYYNKIHLPIDVTKKARDIINKLPMGNGLTDAEMENIIKELTYIITEQVGNAVSDDKIYDIVMRYMQNNTELFRGEPGKDGKQGEAGKDGYSPIKGIDYNDGKPGKDGEDGVDGYSPKVTVEETENGHKVSIEDKYGTHTFDVENGKNGKDATNVIPDLSQNDETKPDYVKNRTHYEETVLIGKGTATGDWSIIELTQSFDWNNAEIFVNGEKVEYEVWDNIEQENLIQIATDGNAFLHYYNVSLNPHEITITSWTSAGTHIQIYQSSVKPLEDKYIPDSIARVSDVEEILDELHAYAQNLIGGDA